MLAGMKTHFLTTGKRHDEPGSEIRSTYGTVNKIDRVNEARTLRIR